MFRPALRLREVFLMQYTKHILCLLHKKRAAAPLLRRTARPYFFLQYL